LKDTPTFEQMWNACSQEEASVSLTNNKEDEEENISNAYSAHHEKKGTFKKFKGPKKKVDLSKIKCYNCHKMGEYKSHCLESPRNKKREREYVNVIVKVHHRRTRLENLRLKIYFPTTLREYYPSHILLF